MSNHGQNILESTNKFWRVIVRWYGGLSSFVRGVNLSSPNNGMGAGKRINMKIQGKDEKRGKGVGKTRGNLIILG